MIFENDDVHRLDLTFERGESEALLADLESMAGPCGSGVWPSSRIPGNLLGGVPRWGAARARMGENEWTEVAVRFCGNSSLVGPWAAGKRKLPLLARFDGKPFFGFRRMRLLSGARDPTVIREKLASDVLRASAIPAARAAFCRLFVDTGDGPVYWGLYTLVEDVADRFLADTFADGTGTLYEAVGKGAEWREFLVARGFVQLSGPDVGMADLRAAVEALNGNRLDAERWRASLDARLDVSLFLRWLATNTAIGNRDTYGHKQHNYFLYGAPWENGRFKWIPSDHHLAFRDGPGPRSPVLRDVGKAWPLIRYLLDDPVWGPEYGRHLLEAVRGPLAPDRIVESMAALHARIAPFVEGPDGERPPFTHLEHPTAFRDGLRAMQSWSVRRAKDVLEALASPQVPPSWLRG